jgi:transcriptional regulator with XRE-family HTH domain
MSMQSNFLVKMEYILLFLKLYGNITILSSILGKIKMTKKELAKRLGIDVKTLDSWEENRKEVMRLIRLGLAAEEHIDDVKKYLENIKQNNSEFVQTVK